MTELKDLCCVEACVLLSPNHRQGAELVALGLLELSLNNYLTIHCTPVSTTIEIKKDQLKAIKEHEIYKAFHIFLKEIYSTKPTAPLQDVIQTAQKYFGLGLEGFNTYAIKPALQSKHLIVEEQVKRFFIFKAKKINHTQEGESLKTDLVLNLEHPEQLLQHHALLMPDESKSFDTKTLTTIKCFKKAYAKQLKNSAINNTKEPGLF